MPEPDIRLNDFYFLQNPVIVFKDLCPMKGQCLSKTLAVKLETRQSHSRLTACGSGPIRYISKSAGTELVPLKQLSL